MGSFAVASSRTASSAPPRGRTVKLVTATVTSMFACTLIG